MSNSKIISLHVILIVLLLFSFNLLGNQINSFGKSIKENSSQKNGLEEKNTPNSNPIEKDEEIDKLNERTSM